MNPVCRNRQPRGCNLPPKRRVIPIGMLAFGLIRVTAHEGSPLKKTANALLLKVANWAAGIVYFIAVITPFRDVFKEDAESI
jgi:hypothetical protein